VACERLGEKLDNLAALAQALAQAWQPNQGPANAGPGAGGAAAGPASPRPEPSPAPGAGETPRESQSGPGREAAFSQQHSPVPAPDGEAGAAGAAPDASRLFDTFARAQAAWPQQAADLRQALQAIMEFLENQAAAAPTRLDLSDILARLQNLEEQQKNLQSQFCANR